LPSPPAEAVLLLLLHAMSALAAMIAETSEHEDRARKVRMPGQVARARNGPQREIRIQRMI
jgi:hypothetical protein